MTIGNGMQSSYSCTMRSDQVDELITCMRDNGDKLDTLAAVLQKLENQNRDFVRWLLLVVCIIALGSKLVEMTQNIWNRETQTTIGVAK